MNSTTHTQILEKLSDGCERCSCPTELWSVYDTCEKWLGFRMLIAGYDIDTDTELF